MRTLSTRTFDPKLAAQAFHALTHPAETQMTIPFAGALQLKPWPSIGDLDNELILPRIYSNALIQATGMAEGIVERLLDQPVHGDLQR